jgi:hypothetical protein
MEALLCAASGSLPRPGRQRWPSSPRRQQRPPAPAACPGVLRACSAPAGSNHAQCLVQARAGVATHTGVAHSMTVAAKEQENAFEKDHSERYGADGFTDLVDGRL